MGLHGPAALNLAVTFGMRAGAALAQSAPGLVPETLETPLLPRPIAYCSASPSPCSARTVLSPKSPSAMLLLKAHLCALSPPPASSLGAFDATCRVPHLSEMPGLHWACGVFCHPLLPPPTTMTRSKQSLVCPFARFSEPGADRGKTW